MQSIFETEFGTAISLGVDCRVRYQISLSRYKKSHPGDFTPQEFEKALYGSVREIEPAGTFPFDWWVTPFPSLLKCIEQDFADLFRRDSLEITEGGSVRDANYGILFHHAFSRANGRVTPEILEAEYETQYRKFQYLSNKFRNSTSRDTNRLYVVAYGGSVQHAQELRRLLTRNHKDAHILCVQFGEETLGIIHEEDGVTIYQMTSANSKPQIARWQGDDHHWGELLDRFEYR